MFIHEIKKLNKNQNKIYTSYLLRKTYRENGEVKTKTISKLTGWPKHLIEEFKKLLKGGKVVDLENDKYFSYEQGKKYGGLKVVLEIAKKIGIYSSIKDIEIRKKIIFLLSGIILSKVKSKNYIANKWKNRQAIEEVIGLKKYINEDSLYELLKWLSNNQEIIEKRIFKKHKTQTKQIFMYDITSSYVEGDQIAFSEYGYNRDKKKGKKQIVIGLLTNKEGMPLSIEVFEGSTRDFKTVKDQLKKIEKNFGIKETIFIGDRGMIKNAQIDEITAKNWYYITCITKPQIEKLLKEEVFQMSLFDKEICEIEYKGNRYILRKNPLRALEVKEQLMAKIKYIEEKINKKNEYLKNHKRASIEVAYKKIEKYQKKLKLEKIIEIKQDETSRKVIIEINEEAKNEYLKLAGCYVLKTNISKEKLNKTEIHEKYKYLSRVERNFRDLKTNFLRIRPIFVRKEEQVKGHVFACMLALKIIRYVENKIKLLKLDIREVFEELDSIQYIKIKYKKGIMKKLPDKLTEKAENILKYLEIKLPPTV